MAVNSVNSEAYVPASGAYITEALTSYEAEVNKTESFLDVLKNAQSRESNEDIMEACKAFESYFIQMMFKEMRKTVCENDQSFFKKSNAEKIFEDMFYEQTAVSSAEMGGIGLAAFMYKQMKREDALLNENILS